MFKWYYYGFLKLLILYDFQKISIGVLNMCKAVHGYFIVNLKGIRNTYHGTGLGATVPPIILNFNSLFSLIHKGIRAHPEWFLIKKVH